MRLSKEKLIITLKKAWNRLSEWRIMDKLISAASTLLLLFVVFVLVGQLNNGYYKVLLIHGGSMSPKINTGDLIILDTRNLELEKGMIATFDLNGTFVTHRIIEISDEVIITQGDANTGVDYWSTHQSSEITLKSVVGIYKGRIPLLGYLFGFLHQITASLLS